LNLEKIACDNQNIVKIKPLEWQQNGYANVKGLFSYQNKQFNFQV
jgi:hypothetical protein